MRLELKGWPHWRSAECLLIGMAVVSALCFQLWSTLLNNFVVEQAGFTGWEIGVLQSVREIPGFLAFTAIFLLLFIREQRLALIALLLLAIGTGITGFFPSLFGLLVTTTIMSVGFHYFETVNQSLALQWLPKHRAPVVLGRILAAGSIAGIAVMAAIWLAFELLAFGYQSVYFLCGLVAVAVTIFFWLAYPLFDEIVPQRKQIILRKRYWLYYALTFLSGARRQIFVVFAGFMLVEKFGFSIAQISALFILNALINVIAAPQIGRLIVRFGERRILIAEYLGLIVIFSSYAIVSTAWFAAALYVLDHVFFAMAIAIKTYFQKIADPADFAPTAGVAFTINHIAAVFIPILFGVIWLWSPAAVFLAGALIAAGSLGLAFMVPRDPSEGSETIWRTSSTGTQQYAKPAE